MSDSREERYCAPSLSKVFSQVKRASLEALQLPDLNSSQFLRRWCDSLRDLGLPKPEQDRLAVRDVASLSKSLQAMDFRSFSRELLNLGKSLARQEIALHSGLAMIETLSHDYQSALCENRYGERETPESQLRRTELALSVSKLCFLAARILATGYSKQLEEERRSRNSRNREAEEILHRTSSILTNIYERERSKISRRLQEKLGHYLVGLKLHLENLTRAHSEGSSEQFSAGLEGSSAIVDEAIRSVRRMVLDLGPAVVREVGLIPAVRMYVRQYSSRFWIDVTIDVQDLPTEIPMALQVAVYWLSQQVLDFCRQSQAKNIRMSFKSKKGAIVIAVELDRGSAHVPRKSLDESWTILLNRAQLLGAVLDRKPADVGSRIEIMVPPGRVSNRHGQEPGKALFHVASVSQIH